MGGVVGARFVGALLGTMLVLGGGLLSLLAVLAWLDLALGGGTRRGTAVFATAAGLGCLAAGVLLGRQAARS